MKPVVVHAQVLPVAAFDFDGTLTREESALAFFRWLKRPPHHGFAIAGALAGHLAGAPRHLTKTRLLTAMFGGIARDALEIQARRFVAEQIDAVLRPGARALIASQQARGHRCIIVSASPELWILPFADALGIEGIGTRLVPLDPFAARLDGLNCRGPEKVRRLARHLGVPASELAIASAFGDSSGDTELLACAREAMWKPLSSGRRILRQA